MVDSVAVLAMRRGEANKIDVGLAEELVASLEAAAVAGARAIVLTGHGQVFSRGVDLDTVVENGHDHLELLMRAAAETFAAVFSCPLPVVAAINGDALAGGCVVACACDVRVMSEGSASFGVSPRLIGPFPPIAVEILRFHAGNAAAAAPFRRRRPERAGRAGRGPGRGGGGSGSPARPSHRDRPDPGRCAR
jgi:enoyl-CoA hydratase